jgi:hypothetical protein
MSRLERCNTTELINEMINAQKTTEAIPPVNAQKTTDVVSPVNKIIKGSSRRNTFIQDEYVVPDKIQFDHITTDLPLNSADAYDNKVEKKKVKQD